ncbi:MAG: hypothetical protein HN736_10700 [Anaerolineae bacterium]|jgi:hypothetical protein|nr:hypothetical protein [Anaerolineae bacterium]MBT6812954.1 hypothetical protein [Anaerolineae bacterium]MBT7775160.1 hypothetical protein [Anaerolineae bacterium]
MVEFIVNLLTGWRAITNALETTLADNVAATVPWLAPLIPAAIAYDHMASVLLFDPWLAFVGAAVVELLGLSTVTTAVQFWQYNIAGDSAKPKPERRAPFGIAFAAAAFYFLVVITVNVLLDEAGGTARLAKALLSTLSIVGALTVAIRSQHRRRVDEQVEVESDAIAYQRELEAEAREAKRLVAAERRRMKHEQEMQKLKVSEASKLAETGGKDAESKVKVTGTFRNWRQVPESERLKIATMSMEAVRESYGVGERTAYNWISYAREAENEVKSPVVEVED